VKFCEEFAFRVNRLLERRSDAGQAALFRVGHQLYKGVYGNDSAMRLLWYSLLAFSPYISFVSALHRKGFDWYQWASFKYFLYEYEEHLAAKKGAVPRIPWDEIQRRERAVTIEHILPQTPTGAYWQEQFDKDDGKTLTHDLGNLTLTKDNSSYSNKPFADKKGAVGSNKPCYAESPYFMERELARLEDWNPDTLIARRKRLVGWALDRWRIPDEINLGGVLAAGRGEAGPARVRGEGDRSAARGAGPGGVAGHRRRPPMPGVRVGLTLTAAVRRENL
jgi:hypothetical protein